MHSIIIQVGDKPIKKDAYISAKDFVDGFVPYIADYTANLNDQTIDEAINLVFDNNDIFELDTNKRTVLIKGKKEYFKESFYDFNAYLERLQKKATIESFTDGSLCCDWIALMMAYEDTHGIYISDENGLKTFDQWMREKENGELFFIGGVVDYHF